MSVLQSLVDISHYLSIHQLMDIGLFLLFLFLFIYFLFLLFVVVNTARNICVQVFVWIYVLFFLGGHLGLELLGHVIILCLTWS